MTLRPFVAILLGALVIAGACSSASDSSTSATAETTDSAGDDRPVATYEPVGEAREVAANDGTNRLVGTDQVSDGSQVVVDLVALQGTSGYVVIYQDVNGAPAQLLGASELLAAGSHTNVAVTFDPPIDPAGDHARVFAMLHAETSGNATIDFPGPDAPIAEAGRIVTLQLALTPS